MESIALSAFAIIALSWLIQLIAAWQGKGLQSVFVLLYGIGAALTVVATAQAQEGFTVESWLSLLVLLIVALVYLKIHKK